MAELTPVGPSPVVPNVRKVERDQKLKDNKEKDRQPSQNDSASVEDTEGNRPPIQHIDEIV